MTESLTELQQARRAETKRKVDEMKARVAARHAANGTTPTPLPDPLPSPAEYFAAFDAKVLAAHNAYMKKFNEDK